MTGGRALAYRLACEADRHFIRHTFIDSMRTSRTAGVIAMSRWADVMRVELDDILARPSLEAWVAYHPGADAGAADLYGWCAVERVWTDGQRRLVQSSPLVVYVYVKAAYRRLGVARGLLRAAGVGAHFHYACSTPVVSKLQRAGKLPGARHEHLSVRYPATPEPRSQAQTKARDHGPSAAEPAQAGQ